MKIAITCLLALSVAEIGVGQPARKDGQAGAEPGIQKKQAARRKADADKLYNLVKQARADLRAVRVKAGLRADAAGTYISQEGRRRGERSDGERGEARGEESGARIPKMANHNKVYRNGARLILRFNPKTQVFVGSVTNTTTKTLAQVRVEVHLSNGMELGPTKRVDLKPGATIPVELGAFGNEFRSWVTHPEAGVEEGHGPGGEEHGAGHEARERREHGAGDIGRGERSERRGEHDGRESGERGEEGGNRPSAMSYRPLYNQLQILRGEIHAFDIDLAAGSKK